MNLDLYGEVRQGKVGFGKVRSGLVEYGKVGWGKVQQKGSKDLHGFNPRNPFTKNGVMNNDYA